MTLKTDSVVILHFIRNRSTRFDVYTSNRLSVIIEHSQVNQCFYVETKHNAADLASRGTTAKRKITYGSTDQTLRQNRKINWPDQPGTLKIENTSPKEVKVNVAKAKAYKETWIQLFSNVINWRSLLRHRLVVGLLFLDTPGLGRLPVGT